MASAALLAACASAPRADPKLDADNAELARTHSVYRWKLVPGEDGAAVRTRIVIGEPAPSRADEATQRKIMASIAQAELTCGSAEAPKLVETRRVADQNDRVDEAWVVTRGAAQVAYLVTLDFGAEVDYFVKGRCE